MKKNIKINHDYFVLTDKWQNLRYFFRQGYILPHLIDRLKWFYYPKLFIVSTFPTHLELETSSVCQMRCPMCKTTEMIKKGIDFFGFMDLGLFKKIIDECVNEPLFSIKLSWRGEPLLNPRIIEMISYAKKKGIKNVAFLTNGERLNSELTEGLVNAGLDWISISFDGLQEVYNKIRKPAKFDETLEKIKYIKQYRERQKRKKPLIRIQSLHSAIRGKEEEFLKLWGGIADRVNLIADQKRSLVPQDYRHSPSYICPSPWQRMCIAWNGKVAQCYGDYLMANILGDVTVKSIKEIWHDRPFMQLRELMRNDKRLSTQPCRTCSDGGITEEETVVVGGRKIKVLHYVDQSIDVRNLK